MPRKYIFALIAVAIVFFGLIGLIIANITKPDNKKQREETAQKATPETPKKINKDTKSVSFMTQGKLVGEEQRRAIRITVTPTERRIDVLQGYDEAIVKTQTTANKQSAYDNFVTALDAQGFGNYDTKITQDPKAACPSGKRYFYGATFSNSATQNSWSSTCGKVGNFLGNGSQVRNLFEDQIPEYSKFISGVRLS